MMRMMQTCLVITQIVLLLRQKKRVKYHTHAHVRAKTQETKITFMVQTRKYNSNKIDITIEG
jgi:hypothetical protein